MKKQWYFINSGPCNPAFNMALDEALLDWHSEGEIPLSFDFMNGILQLYRSVTFSKYIKILIYKQSKSKI